VNNKLIRGLVASLATITPNDVVRALRPRELAYLCELCVLIRELQICPELTELDEDPIGTDEFDLEDDD